MGSPKETSRQLVEELQACLDEKRSLQEREAFFRNLLEAVSDVVWAASADGSQFLYINEAAERVYGYARSDFMENPDLWSAVVHPDDQERVLRESRELLERRSIASEYRIVRPDGDVRWLDDHKYVISDDEGHPIRLVGIASDITEQKKRDRALRERERELRSLTESLDEIIYRADPETFEATYVNRAIEDIYGYTKRQWLEDPELWADSIHPEDRERVFGVFAELQEHHRNDVVEYRILTRDGETRWVEDHVSWERDEAGDVVSMNGVMYDVTQRKIVEEQLKQQAQEMLELATPVIQVWEGIVAVPLIGTLDSRRTQRFAEDLLEAIVGTSSDVALVDITGVPTIDTQTAHHLIETIAAVRLLGADVILTGVRPAIAQTLVHLGIDLSGITTRSSLAAGLRVALERMQASV